LKKLQKTSGKAYKTLRRMEKRASMEHQSPSLLGVAERKHKFEKNVLEGKIVFKLCIICVSI